MNRIFTIGIIIILLFLIIGVSAYYRGFYQALNTKAALPTPSVNALVPSTTPTETPLDPASSASAGLVVERFYKWYSACSSQKVAPCDYKSSQDVDTIQLAANISSRASSSANPIFCAQTPPQDIAIDHFDPISNNEITAYVVGSYATAKPVQVLVNLELQSDTWKITDVTCPRV